jgi:PIN domain nuclease of toxin-antitoxin system
VILLDTNAVIWMLEGHARAKPLLSSPPALYLSPVTVLELKLLVEVGKLSTAPGNSIFDVATDPRWTQDSPSSLALFSAAVDVVWTRDPFDRLLVAHARLRRWKLATGDRLLLSQLAPEQVLPLR